MAGKSGAIGNISFCTGFLMASAEPENALTDEERRELPGLVEDDDPGVFDP